MTAGPKLSTLSIPELIELFVAYAIQQDNAMLENDQTRTNVLARKLFDVQDELKSRSGDQRMALVPLFDHSNPHVQLMAAKATLALVPSAARQVLENLSSTCNGPQKGEAGMTIWALDEGIFKPT